jgi:AcrR family transcriptional regulator
MGIAERKEREKQEMRDRILQGAIDMFLTEGYEKTSIRNIAERIEYSPATIYLYYKDKDQLLYDVQHMAFDKLSEVFAREATSENPMERLRQISRAYMKFGRENQAMYDLMFIIRAPMNVVEKHEAWENGNDAFAFLVNCISDCMKQGLVRFKDPMVAALSVWSFTHGLLSLDIRCRFKVMGMNEEQLYKTMETAIDEYLEMIRA